MMMMMDIQEKWSDENLVGKAMTTNDEIFWLGNNWMSIDEDRDNWALEVFVSWIKSYHEDAHTAGWHSSDHPSFSCRRFEASLGYADNRTLHGMLHLFFNE